MYLYIFEVQILDNTSSYLNILQHSATHCNTVKQLAPMSSNIEVQRICENCKQEFTARTTRTKYCSHKCNRRAYKANIKNQKIKASNIETLKSISLPIEELKQKEFLTITETCQLLSVSRWTIWRKVKNNEIQASKIGSRTIIKRIEIDKFLNL